MKKLLIILAVPALGMVGGMVMIGVWERRATHYYRNGV